VACSLVVLNLTYLAYYLGCLGPLGIFVVTVIRTAEDYLNTSVHFDRCVSALDNMILAVTPAMILKPEDATSTNVFGQPGLVKRLDPAYRPFYSVRKILSSPIIV